MSDAREKGLALFAEVYGPEMAAATRERIAASTEFGSKQSEWTIDWVFGEIWTRPGLERKLRSCAVLGMLIGQSAHDEIKFHTKMGIANGLTREELEEVFYTTFPYVGFPAANVAKSAMLAAFAELDAKDPT